MPVKLECGLPLAKLSAFADGELPAPERIELERHLSTCSSCLARASDLRAGSALVRAGMEIVTDEVDFSDFSAQVMARLAPQRVSFAEQWKVRLSELLRYRRGALISVAAAAAALIAVLPWILSGSSTEGYASQRMALQSVSTDPEAHVAPVIMQGDRGNAIIWLVSHHHGSEPAEVSPQASEFGQPEMESKPPATQPKINQERPRGGEL
jgi:anti-sigma factor RsiW